MLYFLSYLERRGEKLLLRSIKGTETRTASRIPFFSLVNARIHTIIVIVTIYNRGRTIFSLSLEDRFTAETTITISSSLVQDYLRMFTPRFDKRPDIALRAW